MKNLVINVFIFFLIFLGSLLIAWHFIQEPVILYLTQTPINPNQFEANLREATQNGQQEDNLLFDWSAIEQNGAFEWIAYIGYEVPAIGELIIPAIDLRLPIFHGIQEPNITIGAGTMKSGLTMGEGNYSLASHWNPNSGITFGALYRVQVGDVLILRDAFYLYVYETIVGGNYIIEPSRVDIVDYVPGRKLLTLMTCTPGFGDDVQRVLVRGELVEKISIEEIQNAANLLEELTNVSELDNAIVHEIAAIVKMLDETEIPFPILEVSATLGVSFMLATLVLGLSNKSSKRKK